MKKVELGVEDLNTMIEVVGKKKVPPTRETQT
jgi:hypothetical protein